MAELTHLETADALTDLAKLDMNAVHAYDQAIKNTELISVRDQLAEFREDHARHASQLRSLIEAFGVVPPEYDQDVKGVLLEGFTALRSITGVEGALKAMRTNEELTNRRYRETLALPLPPQTRQLLEREYDDEQNHLRVIERALAERVWEH